MLNYQVYSWENDLSMGEFSSKPRLITPRLPRFFQWSIMILMIEMDHNLNLVIQNDG